MKSITESEYWKMRSVDREAYIMPIIIKSLQEMGGSAMANELRKYLYTIEPNLEPVITKMKSGKSGRPFRPFEFDFRFALKSLLYADYVDYKRMAPIELTDKGIDCDVESLNPVVDVYPLSEPKWKEKAEAKAKQKEDATKSEQKDNSNDNDDETDLDDPSADLAEEFKTKLLDAIAQISPKKFEALCRKLLNCMGVMSIVDDKLGIAYSGDGGIDGYGYHMAPDYRTSSVAIQAKRWQGKVSSPEIDRFRGAIDKFRADYGIFITNSYYTKEAVEASRAGTRAITLIDGDKLVELIERYQVYVKPVTTYVLDDFYM